MEAIKAKAQNCNIEMLKEMAQSLMNDYRDEAGVVQDVVLDELMGRIPEADFVAFCDTL